MEGGIEGWRAIQAPCWLPVEGLEAGDETIPLRRQAHAWCHASFDFKVEAPQHRSVEGGDVDLPFATIAVLADAFEAPGAPGGRAYFQGDVVVNLAFKIIDMTDLGGIFIGFNMIPHINAFSRRRESRGDCGRHAVFDG